MIICIMHINSTSVKFIQHKRIEYPFPDKQMSEWTECHTLNFKECRNNVKNTDALKINPMFFNYSNNQNVVNYCNLD